jgi:preprotein translocase subunit SecA
LKDTLMLNTILTKIMGSKNERTMKKLQPVVERINGLESEIEKLGDDELRGRKELFRERLAGGESLDDLLPEAFAVVREAGKRVLGMRHYDVQLIGGMVLHQGRIAEMKTGEGKTLVATLPAYLNALEGKGVHIVTVNDYLARRDSEWMGRVYRFLGMSVGVIQHDMSDQARQEAYAQDITYGTNNEFGFDYLRDNMKFTLDSMVQRRRNFAIVDEVDSILIDEARTPLIISGPAEESTEKYSRINAVIPRLKKGEVIQGGKEYEYEHTGDYVVDEKAKTVSLTEAGVERCQELLGVDNLYDPAHMDLVHHVNQALKAHVLFQRDVDYMLKDGQVVIVDEFTGRLMPGRRWSDGLHQAVEAKEGVKIERENQTLATITFQNFFRMYEKLSGMTGTADTEAVEFDNIYELEVLVIPTNRDLIRIEHPDVIYRTEQEKWNAVVDEISESQQEGQPVLVGTISIENSEKLSSLLKRKGVRHVVLNAKYHEREAEIVAQAGRIGAVTIATNMAGRGTDILLGGNPEFLARRALEEQGIKVAEASAEDYAAAYEPALKAAVEQCRDEHEKVVELGGLYILGTERHESRRIDNQLRGRSGRQGDPGESRFYLSLEDDLMRRFANERVASIMTRLKIPRDVPIEHNMVTKAIERAQNQVEAQNFEIRKNVLKYDEVMNTQRKIIYKWRNQVLEGEHADELLAEWREEAVEDQVLAFTDGIDPSEWDWDGLVAAMTAIFPTDVGSHSFSHPYDTSVDEVIEAFQADAEAKYAAREDELGVDVVRQLERTVALSIIDNKWREHLAEMDYLRAGIGLRAMGQRDPLVEYQREGFDLFSGLVDSVKVDTLRYMYHVEVVRRQEPERPKLIQTNAPGSSGKGRTVKHKGDKIGRNAPCPCGSGKKYKQCHGRAGAEPLAT